MRRLGLIAAVLAAVAASLVSAGAGGGREPYLVRAIFDNASFVVPGEDVKVAGVRAGRIESLHVTPDNRAAVVLDIEEEAFRDFRADAHCKVRPASLIGEEYIDCAPTQPRAAGAPLPPPLREIRSGDGAGQRLLPVQNTSASVDLDLIAEALRRPERERLALVLEALGAGVAGRGQDLNAVIRRANPALRELDGLMRLLARQNETLERLAVDSDRVLAPLARERESVSGFVEEAGEVAAATAARREELGATVQRLPLFLRELRPTMGRLEELAAASTPVVTDLGAAAPRVTALLDDLGPFSRAATPALRELGAVARPGVPALRAARPVVADLRALGRGLRPVAATLSEVLRSLERTRGIEGLMDYIFFQGTSVNGFDSIGHFLRVAPLVNVCSSYATEPVPGCSANFNQTEGAGRPGRGTDPVLRRTSALLHGADPREVLAGGRRRGRSPDEGRPRGGRERGRRADRPRPRRRPAGSPPAASPPAAPPANPTGQLLDYLFGSEG